MLQRIDYADGDASLTGWFAAPAGDRPVPGVLVAHEAPGVGPHVKAVAERLTGSGYAALALDLYGGEGFALEAAQALHRQMMETPGLMVRRARAGLAALQAQPQVDGARLAGIGFCQGGITVLELARDGAPLRAAIGFHPGLKRPAGSREGPIAAKVLMMVGDADPVVPAADRLAFARDMDAAGADWQLHLYGGVGHSFTNPAVDAMGYPGFAYEARAARRAWTTMLGLLAELFQ
ncbi:MAG: dienelactone hydrolase family protein [Alphaproteobacteria bacterium]|nr:dienelactone hydrolase family protein [Alphaproteobacteria bacterium]